MQSSASVVVKGHMGELTVSNVRVVGAGRTVTIGDAGSPRDRASMLLRLAGAIADRMLVFRIRRLRHRAARPPGV